MSDGFLQSRVSVVLATLNEREGIGPTLRELKTVLKRNRMLVIDGNSLDGTGKIAEDLGAKVLLQAGRGKGPALHQGIEHIDDSERYIAFIDGDYTYPAVYIPRMIEILEKNPNVGMVIGNRFTSDRKSKSSFKFHYYLGNRLLGLAQHLMNGIDLNDPLSGLRVVRTEILKAWKPRSKGFDIEAEMNFHVERSGYEIAEIPIEYRPRLGQKKLGLRNGFEILMRIILEGLYDDLGAVPNYGASMGF